MTRWLRAAEGLLLGGWFGSWALFAFVIAPTAFRTLPSAEVAGELVAPVLRTLHYYAIVAGLALSAIAFALRRGRLAIGLPVVLAILCVFSQFGITAAIAEVRPSAFGPGTPAEAAGRFQHLHILSRSIFGSVLAGTGLLIALHAATRSRASEPPG